MREVVQPPAVTVGEGVEILVVGQSLEPGERLVQERELGLLSRPEVDPPPGKIADRLGKL